MTLNEIITEVYTQTNRPDLVAPTLAAVRSVTAGAHALNDFDLDEAIAVLWATGDSAYEWKLPLSEISNSSIYQIVDYGSKYHLVVIDTNTPDVGAPPVRRILTVWAVDTNGDILYELVRQTPGEIFDKFGNKKQGVYRLIGGALSIRTEEPVAGVAVQYLAAPVLTEAGWNSWITDVAPWYIVHMAAAAVLGPVCGKVDEANQQRMFAQQHLASILEHIRG